MRETNGRERRESGPRSYASYSYRESQDGPRSEERRERRPKAPLSFNFAREASAERAQEEGLG